MIDVSATWTRTAKSTFISNVEDVRRHMTQLVHGVNPRISEWMSVCGYPFLSYETSWEPRVVTCVWCLAGLPRKKGP